MMNKLSDWLPTTNKEVKLRGWDELDVILFTGDAYVDHPAFGAAVIGRLLEVMDYGWPLFHNQVYTTICRISPNWERQKCFLQLPAGVWIQW